MTSRLFVGNDVVDLTAPRTASRSPDDRFLARVFAEYERETIAAADDPDIEVWYQWAAKETSFKIASKLLGTPPPFAHRAFVVAWESDHQPSFRASVQDEGTATVRRGCVRYGGLETFVEVDLATGRFVHAYGYGTHDGRRVEARVLPRVERLDQPGASWSGALEDLRPSLTKLGLDAVYSRSAAAVRLGAREQLARTLRISERRIEIACAPGLPGQRPPFVLVDKARAEVDVSLSHDGIWISWATWQGLAHPSLSNRSS